MNRVFEHQVEDKRMKKGPDRPANHNQIQEHIYIPENVWQRLALSFRSSAHPLAAFAH
jgi:hypothetical protein